MHSLFTKIYAASEFTVKKFQYWEISFSGNFTQWGGSELKHNKPTPKELGLSVRGSLVFYNMHSLQHGKGTGSHCRQTRDMYCTKGRSESCRCPSSQTGSWLISELSWDRNNFSFRKKDRVECCMWWNRTCPEMVGSELVLSVYACLLQLKNIMWKCWPFSKTFVGMSSQCQCLQNSLTTGPNSNMNTFWLECLLGAPLYFWIHRCTGCKETW